MLGYSLLANAASYQTMLKTPESEFAHYCIRNFMSTTPMKQIIYQKKDIISESKSTTVKTI